MPTLVNTITLISMLLAAAPAADRRQEHNTLTDAEKQAGWRLLFDG